jgi:transposase
MGWRVYVTNHPKETFSLSDAVNLYREEYQIERRIRNLKEEVTALLPIFLKKTIE